MSIADKLTYLNTTKQLLKTEINKINNVLDDNSTFRSYPQELFNGYLDILNNGTDTLWNNLEKVSASGEEATLENVETAPIKMVLNGNTSQDTTSGKNLLNIPSTYSVTLRKDINIDLTENTDYIFSYENIATTVEADAYSLIEFYNGDQFVQRTYLYYTDVTRTFTTSGAITKMRIYAGASYNTSSGKTSTYTNLMLEKGSTATSYEPYTGGQPSPSPDYPQQVKVVKGENVVSVSGKNLFDEVTELGRLESSSSSSNFGREVASKTQLRAKNYIQVKPNTTYFCYFGSIVSGAQVFVFAYDENYNAITSYGYKTFTNTTITTPEGARYIRFYMNAQYGTTYNNDICIVEGTSTPYVPYSKTDYPINLNANMFDPTQIPEGNFEKRLSTTGGLYGDVDYFVSDWIPIQPNTEYEVNWTPEAKKRICFYSSFLVSSFISSNDTENIFKTPNNATYMRFSNLASEASNLSVKLKNSLELCKINTYKDYFHKDSGKWYVHKEIEKVVLDGSENWSTNTPWNYTNTNVYTSHLTTPTFNAMFSNYFSYVTNTFAKDINGIMQVVWGTHILLRISNTIAPTIEDFKTWLSTHNTIVYYVLATPTETEITNTTLIEQLEAISKAKSVKDKTYITQTNDELPFILDVEAIKEYEVN